MLLFEIMIRLIILFKATDHMIQSRHNEASHSFPSCSTDSSQLETRTIPTSPIWRGPAQLNVSNYSGAAPAD